MTFRVESNTVEQGGKLILKMNYFFIQCLCWCQNAALGSLLSLLRGHPSPEEQCSLSVLRMITQLWSRMNPSQVTKAHKCTHTKLMKKLKNYFCVTCLKTVADPPCAPGYFETALVSNNCYCKEH